jgi:hypothetical protein
LRPGKGEGHTRLRLSAVRRHAGEFNMRFTVFACLAALLLAVPARAQDQGEIAFWESIKDSKSPAELQTYLDAYPNGTFAALARIRIKALAGGTAAPAEGAAEAPPAAPPSTATDNAPSPPSTPPPAQPPAAMGNEPTTAPPGPAESAPAPSTGAREAEQLNWSEFRSQPGRFVVVLPGEPKLTFVPPDPNGRSEHRFLVDLGKKAFLVAWDDYAPGKLTRTDPTVVLDTAQDALLKGLKATLRASGPMAIGHYPGRELLFDTPDGNTGKVHVYVIRNRLYQVWYMGPTGEEESPDVARFLDSFQYTGR